ncbi:MAG: hypothetical protein HYZ31_01805 [Gammaproteobacteria bacterium]|jgi:hypothetical protein|nr:hypothetical protein [Gammaproteobacteria bacterium]
MKNIVQRLFQKKPEPRFTATCGTEVKILFSSENPSMLGKTMKTTAIELSPRSIRLEVEHALAIGSVLDVSVMLAGTNRIYNLTGNVRYRLPSTKGHYHVVLALRERNDIRSDLKAWKHNFDQNLGYAAAG